MILSILRVERFFSTPETKIHKSLSRWFYITSLSVMKFFNYALKMSDVESFTSRQQ